ncbi:MAG: hypothetical protein P8O97_00805 [Gammaproteobacteria bacterium]|nr:hypothetical protein [Gammaproteobacteria bacterium]
MILRTIILSVAKNKYLHVFLGVMTIYAGFSEISGTLVEDFSSWNFKGAHGVMFIGVLHLLHSLSEFIEAADYLKESID